MLIEPNPYQGGCTIGYRVMYAETDAMGVVYYAQYFVYFERLRNELIRQSGKTYREIESDGLLLPVTEAHAGYHGSARYDDLIHIHGRPAWMQGSRFRVDYKIYLENELLVDGYTIHTTINKEGQPRRIPKSLMDRFGPEAGPAPD